MPIGQEEMSVNNETTSLLDNSAIQEPEVIDTTYHDKDRTGTMLSTISNICNSAVGAGVLGLPFAIKNCGLLGGIIILLMVNLFTIYSLRMIVFLIQKSKIYSYEQLGETIIGKWFGYYMKALIVFSTVGTQIVYVVILGDILPPILKVLMGKRELHWIFYRKEFLSGIVLVFLIFPLTLFKNIDSLAFASAFAILNVVYIVGLIITYKFIKPSHIQPNIVWFNFSYEVLLALPIYIYSHNCHIYIFLILKELKEPTHRRMEFATTISVITYGFIYMSMGIFGYLSFYGETKDNILLNFSSTKVDYPVLIGRIGISLTIIFSFPMILFACRRSLDSLFFRDKEFSQFRHSSWAIILCGTCYLIGNLVPEVSTVFGLIGASGSMQVMFILPSLFYLLYVVWGDRKFSIRNVIFSILPFFIFVFGIILAFFSTGVVIYNMVLKYTK